MSETERRHYRYRIRFAKKGLIRFVGHQELMRVFERAIRRCGFRLRPREGFRTKVRLSFPLSLALGFEAEEEVFQVDFQEPIPSDQLARSLQAELPEGLTLVDVRQVPPYRRMRVLETHYRLPLPSDRADEVRRRIGDWEGTEPLLVESERKGTVRTVDLRPALLFVRIVNGYVEFGLRADSQHTARPIDVLRWLGLADLLQEGLIVTRTRVVLEDEVNEAEEPGNGR